MRITALCDSLETDLLCERPDVVLEGGDSLLEVGAHRLRDVGVTVVLSCERDNFVTLCVTFVTTLTAQLLVHGQHLLEDHQHGLLHLLTRARVNPRHAGV